MSTRCQLGVYRKEDSPIDDKDCFIYRHADGYPEGVLPDIVDWLKWFNKNRGIGDTEYCAARLIQHLTNQYDGDETLGTYRGMLGHGVGLGLHGDIEFFYHISPTKVKVYEVKHAANYDTMPVKDWPIVEEVNLTNQEGG